MKDTIIDLWNGNVEPIANCGKGNAEIENIIRLMEKNYENLNALLDVKQRKIFEK